MADVMHVLHRLVNHLGAFAGNVEVGEHGRIVQIEISREQVAILKTKVPATCRPQCSPEMKRMSNTEIIGVEDLGGGKKQAILDTKPFVVNSRSILWKATDVPGDGSFVGCYVYGDGAKQSVFRYAFYKQVLSNFCKLNAVPLKIKDESLQFECVESLFQLIKFILSGDIAELSKAVKIEKPGDVKTLGRDVKGVPLEWFKPSLVHGPPVAFTTMVFLQAWAATCPFRHRILMEMMMVAYENRVPPENVFFYEHTDLDSTYGTGCHPMDVKILFSDEIDTKGQNIMGKALNKTAQKVFELQTHGAYINWFTSTFEQHPLFVLKG